MPPRSSRLRPALLALVALATLATGSACRRRQTVTPVAPVSAGESDAERLRREADEREAERLRVATEDAAARERAARERTAREGAGRGGARALLEAPVYFSYDRSDLEAEARTALEAKLGVLQENPGVRIRIIGHTDARGSDEYNLALGQRRAAAAKRFLTQREIDAERIDIAGVGEEQPVCEEESERCWTRNRRAEFVIVAGTVADAGAAAAGTAGSRSTPARRAGW